MTSPNTSGFSPEIELIPIDEIIPYQNNPRDIGDTAVGAVAASIRAYGFNVPIVLNLKKVIVAGHTRYLASKQLGLGEIPCIIKDFTPEQERAWRIIDNKTSELGRWSYEKLKIEMQQLDLSGEVFELNFSPLEISSILQIDPPEAEPEAEPAESEHKGKKSNRHNIMLDPGDWNNCQAAISFLKEHEPDLTEGQAIGQICQEWLRFQAK